MNDNRRELHARALDIADGYVAAIGPTDLDRATPCDGWTLADLLAHMIGQHRGFARAVRCGTAPAEAYAPVPFDPEVWHGSVADVVVAFAGADLDGYAVEIEIAPGPLPLRRILDAQLFDTVIHTWDLAQALGRDFSPPEPVLAVTAAIAAGLPEQAYGPGAAFAARLTRTGSVWGDTLALVGRRVPAGRLV